MQWKGYYLVLACYYFCQSVTPDANQFLNWYGCHSNISSRFNSMRVCVIEFLQAQNHCHMFISGRANWSMGKFMWCVKPTGHSEPWILWQNWRPNHNMSIWWSVCLMFCIVSITEQFTHHWEFTSTIWWSYGKSGLTV